MLKVVRPAISKRRKDTVDFFMLARQQNIDSDMIKSFVSKLYHTHFERTNTKGCIAFQHLVPKDYKGDDRTSYIEYANTLDEVLTLVEKYNGKNCYITVNEQIGGKGKDYTLLINAFYIDIDDHRENPDGELTAFISKKIEDGTIPRPDIRVKTGRGEGHYFLLRKPIYVTENAAGLIKVRDYTYQKIFDYYKNVLHEFDSAYNFIDTSVSALDKYCRLPGTVNMVTGTRAELLWCDEGQYKGINAIREAFGIKDAPKKEKKEKKAKTYFRHAEVIKIANARFSGAMHSRSLALDRMCSDLMARQGHSPWGELYLFWKYNTIRCYTDKLDAQEEIISLNEDVFDGHYGGKAIEKIFRASEKVDIYRIRTAKLINKFNLSFEDAKSYGFGDVSKTIDEEMDEAEKELKEKYLTDLIKEFRPKYSLTNLLKAVNVMLTNESLDTISRRTLQRRLKDLNLEYKKGTLAKEDTAEYKAEQKRKEEVRKKKVVSIVPKIEESTELSTDLDKNVPNSAPIYYSSSNNQGFISSTKNCPYTVNKTEQPSTYQMTPSDYAMLSEYNFQLALKDLSTKAGNINYMSIYIGLGGCDYDYDYADESGCILSQSVDAGLMTLDQQVYVSKFIRSLHNENRLRAYGILRRLALHFKKNKEGFYIISYDDVNVVIKQVYKKSLPFVVPYTPTPQKVKDHMRHLDQCKQTWNWFFRGLDKTDNEKQVVDVYKRYNEMCKAKIKDKCGNELVDGFELSYKTLKTVVLFLTTTDELKQIARSHSDEELDDETIINDMIRLCKERYPEKFVVNVQPSNKKEQSAG